MTTKRILSGSSLAIVALVLGAVLSRERDWFYMLAYSSPFLACFLGSLVWVLATRRRAKPPDLPESVVVAVQQQPPAGGIPAGRPRQPFPHLGFVGLGHGIQRNPWPSACH
jgi:hypothetical protein